ncbi:MAG: ABC transporter substrate-binding protein [Clostridiaceae bacterium]|nr:ABC transporter substrate-binding protein [Clostridiaceae bacterium]
MKKIHSTSIVLLIMAIIISGCGQQPQSPQQEPITGINDGAVKVIYEDVGPSQGGILKLFMVTPRTLNPLTTQDIYVRQLSSFVFDSLFYEDESGLIKKGLTESFKLSQDGLILDIELRDNILFHDGKTLSSDDVAFTLETIKNAGKKSLYYEHVSNIQSIKTLTRLSFRLILNKTDPKITEKLTFPIVPEHVFKDWPIEGHKASLKLIGTGPFKYESYSVNEITLLRNDSWWFLEAEDGLSHPIWLDGITFKIYQDESQMMQAFQRQQIDIAWLEEGDLDSYSKRSDIFFNKYVSNNLEFLVLSPVGTSSSPIRQEEFRSILIEYLKEYEKENPINRGESAMERQNVHSEEKLNKNAIINKLINLGFLYNYDKGYLYTYKNNEKVPVQLSLIYNGLNADREYTSEWLAEALAEIGIKVDTESADIEKQQSLVRSGEFDMMLLGCRIPLYATIDEVSEATKKSLNLSNTNSVILPLYRKYGAVLYNNYIRGERNPNWKNIYNGWQNWYLVYPNP